MKTDEHNLESASEQSIKMSHAVASLMPAQAAPAVHFQSVDGLRGLACLAVVFHHCYLYAGQCTWPLGLPLLLARGYLGVEVFFVLSGFCMAYPVLRHPEKPDDWRQFARKRVRRILPAYWSALMLLGMVSFAVHHFRIQPFASSSQFATPTARELIYGFFLIGVVFNTSFWTLTLEARWYIVFPFLITTYRRLKGTGLLALTCGVSLAYTLLMRHGVSVRLDFLIGPLPLFLPLFALGICSAQWMTGKNENVLRLLSPRLCRCGLLFSLLLVSLFVPANSAEVSGYARIIPGGLLALFLLLTALRDPVGQHLFTWKPLVRVGSISYSLYLIHQPLIQMIYCLTKPLHWTGMAQFFFYYGFTAALCTGVAYVFYCVAERPFLTQKQKGPAKL